MMLTQQLLELAQNWRQVFAQERSLQRSHQLMLALLLCVGRKWITRIHRLRNLPNLDWSADYKLFSRAPWDTRDLFLPTIRESLPFFGEGPIMIAGDETRTRRAGKKVKRARWTRDPLSPPFHVNFIKGSDGSNSLLWCLWRERQDARLEAFQSPLAQWICPPNLAQKPQTKKRLNTKKPRPRESCALKP